MQEPYNVIENSDLLRMADEVFLMVNHVVMPSPWSGCLPLTCMPFRRPVPLCIDTCLWA